MADGCRIEKYIVWPTQQRTVRVALNFYEDKKSEQNNGKLNQSFKFPKKFKMDDGRHFEICYITIIESKNDPILMKFCVVKQIETETKIL